MSPDVSATVRSLLARCDVTYKVIPFDHGLYQECIEDAMQRGYPVDGTLSVRTYLNEGVVYASTACAHLCRKTQVWVALVTSCFVFLDDAESRFPAELPSIYQFNNRFLTGLGQMSAILDAFADMLCQIPELFQPIPTNLITTSILNFVTANLLEHETQAMKISSAAQQYPAYQRALTGVAEAYGFVVFPRELLLNEYVQAIPEMMVFIQNLNDVLSFYKEEQSGEITNQVSILAARTGKSKLHILQEMMEISGDLYDRIVKILEGSPAACGAFRQYTAGYVYFHTSSKRYKLADLDLD